MADQFIVEGSKAVSRGGDAWVACTIVVEENQLRMKLPALTLSFLGCAFSVLYSNKWFQGFPRKINSIIISLPK